MLRIHVRTYVRTCVHNTIRYACRYGYGHVLHGVLGCIFKFVLPSSFILSSGTSCPVMKEKETSPLTSHGSLMKVGAVYT